MKSAHRAQMLFTALIFVCCAPQKPLSQARTAGKVRCAALVNSSLAPVVTVVVDGQPQFFLFDSAAPMTVIREARAQNSWSENDSKSLKSPLFEVANKQVPVVKEKAKVCETNGIAGTLGLDLFFNADEMLLLDFTEAKICTIDAVAFQNRLALKAFRKLESRKTKQGYEIELEISGQKQRFLLDTAYEGYLQLPETYHQRLAPFTAQHLEWERPQNDGSHTLCQETTYENVPLVMVGYKLASQVTVSANARQARAGIEFLRAFDWMIDKTGKNIYAKRNHRMLKTRPDHRKRYWVTANETIRIVGKEKQQTKYAIGTQIQSVDHETVTPENCCRLAHLLNQTEDWDTLKIGASTTSAKTITNP